MRAELLHEIQNLTERTEKPNALEKLTRVLAFFAEQKSTAGTLEIAEHLGFNKSTVSRILMTLHREGFLIQNQETRQYSLGPMISRLSKAINQSLDGQSTLIAQPFCDQLRDEVSETVHFELLAGNHIFLAYVARSPQPVSVSLTVGDRVYPHVHAGAKCIAAYSHPRLVSTWLSQPLPRFCATTNTDHELLFRDYSKIVLTGYSVDDRQHNSNIYAIAAPVFDSNGRATAGVVVVAPYSRKDHLDAETTINKTRQTAKCISERLLCPGDYEEICNTYINNPLI